MKFIPARFALSAVLSIALFAPFTTIAAGYITLDSFSGHPGVNLQVSGGGWTTGDVLNFFFGSSASSIVGHTTVGAGGSFTTPLLVPANTPQGSLSIIGVDASTHEQASNAYYVTPLTPSITVTSPSHVPFANVTVVGSGFAPLEHVTISLAGAVVHATTDMSGSFTGVSLAVPQVASGLYVVHAVGDSSGATSVDYLNYFWIDTFYPSVSPSSYYLVPGSTLSFTGSGFAPNETIVVTQTGKSGPLSSFAASADGSFINAGGFTLPASLHGQTVNFTLTGGQSHVSASTGMTVGDFYPYASPSSYYLTPGLSLSFSGGGFAAGEVVHVYLLGSATSVSTFTTTATGSFLSAGSVTAPFSAAGSSATYRLVGASSGAETTASTAVGQFYPSISPSVYYVVPNATITVGGSGFAPNETITLSINGTGTSSVSTGATGLFSGTVVAPFSSTGSAQIHAIGSLSNTDTTVGITLATFYPSITPSSFYLFPGDAISFTGSGFAPNEAVTMTTSNGTSAFTANALGTIHSASTTVPFGAATSFVASFMGSLSHATAVSTVGVGVLTPYLSSDVYSATQGQTIHVTGFHFAAGEAVHVSAGTFSTTTHADASGTTPAVSVPTPFGASTLHVGMTGVSTGVSGVLDVSLVGFSASLTSSSYYAQHGASVMVTGSGFAPNEQVQVSNGTATTTVGASALGGFSTNVTLPISASLTSASVLATGQTSGASAALSIGLAPFSPQVTPSTYYTSAGLPITFTGSGFAPSEAIGVTFNGSVVPSTTASSTGGFSYVFTPPVSSSLASFVFTGQLTHAASSISVTIAPFTASIQLSTYYAQGGTAQTVTGTGFAPNETVNLQVQGTTYASVVANASGAFTQVGVVPFATPGSVTIHAVGALSGASGDATMTVAPVYTNLTLASYAGAPGEAVTLVGSGYLPNEPIQVMTNRSGTTVVHTFNADASGNFSNAGYIVPVTYHGGTLVITVRGTHSFDSKDITYYVTGA